MLTKFRLCLSIVSLIAGIASAYLQRGNPSQASLKNAMTRSV